MKRASLRYKNSSSTWRFTGSDGYIFLQINWHGILQSYRSPEGACAAFPYRNKGAQPCAPTKILNPTKRDRTTAVEDQDDSGGGSR